MKASDILGFNDLNTKTVTVKEWNCDVNIRELGLEDGLAMFAMVKDVGDKPTLTATQIAQVVAWGVVDNGVRVFSDDDVPELAKKSHRALMFLHAEIMSLSGKDAEKN